MEEYLKDPQQIEDKSFQMIKASTDLSAFDELQQQIVMRLVHTCGDPGIAQNVRISENAVQSGVSALENNADTLCDVEMVRQGLTKRFLTREPLCFLNHPNVPDQARQSGETRTMTALNMWRPKLQNSIAIIGNAPTALFRLMEMLEQGADRPAVVIGIPVGFVGAPESKNYLWDNHKNLGVECITVLGRTGGSALAAGAFNTLIRLKNNLRF